MDAQPLRIARYKNVAVPRVKMTPRKRHQPRGRQDRRCFRGGSLIRANAAFRHRIGNGPAVQFCFEVSGACNILLIIAVPDMPAFNYWAEGLLANDPVVRRYQTSFVEKELIFDPGAPLTWPMRMPGMS